MDSISGSNRASVCSSIFVNPPSFTIWMPCFSARLSPLGNYWINR